MAESGILLFSVKGNNLPLAQNIATKLGISLAPLEAGFFENKETRIQIQVSVRGKRVYLLQVVQDDPNESIMQLLITTYALKTACANQVVGVIPYLPYSKQSKMRNRGAIPSKLMASLLCRAGMDHVLTVDLHSKEVQGFFDCPVDNLRASPFLIQHIQENIPAYRDAVIVAKSPGAAARANSFAERLRLGLAVIHGELVVADIDRCDGRQSPPAIRSRISSETFAGEVPVPLPIDERTVNRATRKADPGATPFDASFGQPVKIKPQMEVVGLVADKTVILVEGIIDEAADLVVAARLLRESGAKKIYLLATHGLFSGEAPEMLQNSEFDEIVITNTVPVESKISKCPKIRVVDISPVLAEALRRMHNGESLSYLFRNIPLED